MFLFCSKAGDSQVREGRGALTAARIYPKPIVREFDPEKLGVLSDKAADRGEDDGLQGNRQYRDLRGARPPDGDFARSA
jgi:hypothetical protein